MICEYNIEEKAQIYQTKQALGILPHGMCHPNLTSLSPVHLHGLR